MWLSWILLIFSIDYDHVYDWYKTVWEIHGIQKDMARRGLGRHTCLKGAQTENKTGWLKEESWKTGIGFAYRFHLGLKFNSN